MTLIDLQRMGEASAKQPEPDYTELVLTLSLYVNELRKMRAAVTTKPIAARKIAQACQKLAAAAKDLQAHDRGLSL